MTWLEYYQLHECQWDSFQALRDEFEWEFPEEFNTSQFICDRWVDDGENIAAYYEDRTSNRSGKLSFEELKERSNQLANYLKELGVKKGDRVAINVPRKIETLISHVAVWKLGAVSVPLSTLFGPYGLKYRISDSSSTAIIIDESNLDTFRTISQELDSIEQIITVGEVTQKDGELDFWSSIKGQPTDFEIENTNLEDDMVLMYTSGTTGDPKGVLHAHRSTIGHLPGVITNFYNLEIRDDDITWCPTEYSWAGTLTYILASWAFGLPLVAYETGKSFDAEEAFSLIEKYDVTVSQIPPSGLRILMQVEDPNEKYDVSKMRHIASGGEKLGDTVSGWARRVFGASVHELYGQTELWNIIVGDCTKLKESRTGWLGYSLPGHDVEIVDPETMEKAEPGEVGEIVLSQDDPTVLKEYWNKPEKTESIFVDGWVLTNDLGKRNEGGEFKFLGRKDDVIISSGYRIGPEEVEDSITAHQAVAYAGVVGVPNDVRGQVPKAFVVLSDGYEPSQTLKEDLKSYVRENLAAYEYPRHIEFIDELPRTTTGKIQRTKLQNRQN